MSYLRFVFEGTSASGKTKRWTVYGEHGGPLGWIEWKATWRKYWFCPVNGTGYDAGCLTEIGDFLRTETQNHKES